VVEVKLVRSTANHAPATVPFPDLKLNVCWNQPSPRRIWTSRQTRVILSLNCHELELKHLTPIALLSPRVNEVEDAVIGPDSFSQFLVHSDTLGSPQASFSLLRGPVEEPILRQGASRRALGLVYAFGTGDPDTARGVVAFIDQNCATVQKLVLIGGVGS
jgi:hypothetical protein